MAYGKRISYRLPQDGWAQQLGTIPDVAFVGPVTIAVPPAVSPALARTPTLVPSTLPRGLPTAGLLIFDWEDGGQVTYSWTTDIIRAQDGTERRIAICQCPRETYAFQILLSDGDVAYVQSELVKNAAAGKAFAVALTHEALVLTLTASGSTLTVGTTAYSDWCYAGQTVVVLGLDGVSTVTGIVLLVTSTTIVIDVAVGAVGKVGARIMPTIPCYLEESQGIGLYAVNAGHFDLKARATYFGNGSSTWAAIGGVVPTYTDPISSVVYPVWDRGLDIDDAGTSPRALMAGISLTDLGGVILNTPTQAFSDFSRQIDVHFKTDQRRQNLKAFLGAVKGRQCTFLMPTWRPDLVPLSTSIAGSVLNVHGGVRGYTDYAGQFLGSLAHAHLQVLYTSGTIDYVTVTDATDHHDGTEALQLDRSITGTIRMVSFLETCRLDSDAAPVVYNGGVGRSTIPARVVQS